MASLKSYRNERSTKNAYILLLGLTWSGKASAVNLLFGNDYLSKVEHSFFSSTSSEITEFRIPVPVPELGITNSELRVIDTTGLVSTRSLQEDARFFAALDEYLAGHEELSHRLPNVVLIFGRFHDNRHCGRGASFLEMLRAIELFRDRLIDSKYSNVIFVLSNFMSTTRKVQRRPTSRIRSFKQCIEDYSLFPKPISIVVAENKAGENGLPMLHGSYVLPNGDLYPQNLRDKIQYMLSNANAGDPIGEAVIRTAYQTRDPSDFLITAKHFAFGATNSSLEKAVEYMKKLIFPIFLTSAMPTEVDKALAHAHAGMSEHLKAANPDALSYMQTAFNLRNMHNKADIPKTTSTLEILRLLRGIEQNDANSYLMETALGLSAPKLGTHENLLVGHGYNIFEDRPLPTSPFQIRDYKFSELGYKFPSMLTCDVLRESEMVGVGIGTLRIFDTWAEYIQNRLQSLGVGAESFGTVPLKAFSGAVASGSNVYSASSGYVSIPTFTWSALREYRTFELILNDDMDLTPEFSQSVKNLPLFNHSDPGIRNTWQIFFDTYGTHVVKSVFGGGSIEIKMSTSTRATGQEKLGQAEIEDAMFKLVELAEDLSGAVQMQIGNANATNATVDGAGARKRPLTFKFKGGDRGGANCGGQSTDLATMSLGAAVELLEAWRESVELSPVILEGGMKLIPISRVARQLGLIISSEIQRAALALFSSSGKAEEPARCSEPMSMSPK